MLETISLETIALLPDGRPMLSYGTRGQDPALAGGLTSAVYSFTKEIDLMKTASDGLKIDVPGGGKLILRRVLVSGRELFVSVIVRGVTNEQILNMVSGFGRTLGEVIASREDWSGVRSGQFTAFLSRKADIYLEALKRWRGTISSRPIVSIEYKDVIRRALSVLGKTMDLSEEFLRTISNQQLVLKEDEFTMMVAKELIVLTADQELFLALCTKDDQLKTALSVVEELRSMAPQAEKELQTVFEKVKNDFLETVTGSINEQTAFFRLPERRATWINEITQAVCKRMSKRTPLLLLARPLLMGTSHAKGLREMTAEFVEAFLLENGPAGAMKKLMANIRGESGLTRLLNKFVEECGPSFNEDSACLFLSLVEPQQIKDALLNLTGSDCLSKSFVKSLNDLVSKGPPPSETKECKATMNKLHVAIAESYAQILEGILVGRHMFIEVATAVRDHLLKSIAAFQIIAGIDRLAQHKWKVVRIEGNIPKYADLLSAGLLNKVVRKENGTLIVDGEKHTESFMARDTLLLRRLWGNWDVLSTALKGKMVVTLRNEFQSPIQEFLKSHLKTAEENLAKLQIYVRSIGSSTPLQIEFIKPVAERRLYEPLKDECESIYGSVVNLYEKFRLFAEKSMREISSSDGVKRATIAKQILYSIEKIKKQYLSEPAESVLRQIDASFERGTKRLDSEIASVKESIDAGLKLSPSFVKHFNGVLEDPILAIRSYKLPPVEAFFEGGYSELIYTYSSIVLGLGVPESIAQRAISQLKGQKTVSSVLKPLMKAKEANLHEVVAMHLSEYVRMFVENIFSLLSDHVARRYATIKIEGPVDLGIIPAEMIDRPVDYLGNPIGIEWSRYENIWSFKIHPPETSSTKTGSIGKWIDELPTRIMQEKHGTELETLVKAGRLLGPHMGSKVENGIQRLRQRLTPSMAVSDAS